MELLTNSNSAVGYEVKCENQRAVCKCYLCKKQNKKKWGNQGIKEEYKTLISRPNIDSYMNSEINLKV